MDKEKNQEGVWTTGPCQDCGLHDALYKGVCKPCFDNRGMQYDQKDLDELKPKK